LTSLRNGIAQQAVRLKNLGFGRRLRTLDGWLLHADAAEGVSVVLRLDLTAQGPKNIGHVGSTSMFI
jgi:hypothetical protein